MGKIVDLREAINLIWETVMITEEQGGSSECPYMFIVGAGISAPEILSANGIVQHCKEKVRELYKENIEEYNLIEEGAKGLNINSAGYYSYWFGQAYKNKIHRQQYLKQIIKNARISTSNLLLAQILNSKKIATTVITPNFDNQLLKSLNLLGNYDVFSANNILDNIALSRNSEEIQLMHVHGTYEFYDCCNLENEISRIASGQGIKSTAGTIEEFLKKQAPIVIGYSGWEDDVIMSKIKERLQYAALPYSFIWFCYTMKDYEMLPGWLKDSEDVFFVLPEQNCKSDKDEDKEESSILPAEDVFAALITKFGFEAPNLFRNPIQYYIELIECFLPENENVFPTKSWKRRLDHIEENLGDIDRKIIELDDAAARKDVIDISRILKEINYNFISMDDLEHIVEGNILPLLNNKNRIEAKRDLTMFLNVTLDLLFARSKDFDIQKMKKYIEKIFDFVSFQQEKIEKNNLIQICDKILSLCKLVKDFEVFELVVLGTKSEIVDGDKRIELQNEIIQRGINKKEDFRMARLILIAISKQIRDTELITKEQREIINSVIGIHSDNNKIMELYYDRVINFINEEIETEIRIEDVIEQIIAKELSKDLLLRACWIQAKSEDDEKKSLEMASNVVDSYEYSDMSSCEACVSYAFCLRRVILGKIEENGRVEQKYIDKAMHFCERTGECSIASEVIVDVLGVYIDSINSQYEQRELCRKVSEICKNKHLYLEWGYYSGRYVNFLEAKEKEAYLAENEMYKAFDDADQKVSLAIENYRNHNQHIAKELLLEASDMFDKIFNNEYNPAALNVCFMVRRGEIPEYNIPVLEVLNKLKWLQGDAFWHINKALTYVQLNNWKEACEEIQQIETEIDEALEWWSQEDVVGCHEMFMVILLLMLEDKLEGLSKERISEEFWNYCEEEFILPADIQERMLEVRAKYNSLL